MVLHDINQAAFYADRVVALKAGAVFADGTPREMIPPGTVCSLFGADVTIVPSADGDRPYCVQKGRLN